MFTVLIFSDNDIKDKDYLDLTTTLKQNINSIILDININNIDQLIIDCKDKSFLNNKLKLLNTTKDKIQTFPNIDNYLKRNYFFGD